jgi:hypothetical protein
MLLDNEMQVMDYKSTLLPNTQQMMDQQRAHYLDPAFAG